MDSIQAQEDVPNYCTSQSDTNGLVQNRQLQIHGFPAFLSGQDIVFCSIPFLLQTHHCFVAFLIFAHTAWLTWLRQGFQGSQWQNVQGVQGSQRCR